MENKTISFYNEHAKEFCQGTITANMKEIYDLFLNEIPAKSKILDCGCGSGRDSKYFIEKGYDVSALDASIELCKIAQNYTKIPVKNITFNEIDEIETYDGIWACASLLHCKKDELLDVFKKLLRALKKGGILYASFKYGTYEGYKNDRYFTFMTENEIKNLISKLEKIKMKKFLITKDVRKEKENEEWINIIFKKED